MTNFTRNAIKASFWQLLSEKNYSKITVKDVVTACGINRNTFYYHFDSIPALADECVRSRLFDIASRNMASSLDACLTGICRDLLENKNQILNIYNSTERERLERFVFTLSGMVIDSYLESLCLPGVKEDWDHHRRYVGNALFGYYVGWLNNGMRDNYEERFLHFCLLTERLMMS